MPTNDCETTTLVCSCGRGVVAPDPTSPVQIARQLSQMMNRGPGIRAAHRGAVPHRVLDGSALFYKQLIIQHLRSRPTPLPRSPSRAGAAPARQKSVDDAPRPAARLPRRSNPAPVLLPL